MKVLIQNISLVNADERSESASILLENGVISNVNGADTHADEIIDGTDLIAIPGMIDIHSHGADGADVCDGSLSSIRHIATKKLAEGVTTWLPTTLTQPRQRLQRSVHAEQFHQHSVPCCRVGNRNRIRC